jgi:hypothetical protein
VTKDKEAEKKRREAEKKEEEKRKRGTDKKETENEPEVKQESEEEGEPEHECRWCGQKFKSDIKMELHQEKCSANEDGKCRICNKRYKSAVARKQHQLSFSGRGGHVEYFWNDTEEEREDGRDEEERRKELRKKVEEENEEWERKHGDEDPDGDKDKEGDKGPGGGSSKGPEDKGDKSSGSGGATGSGGAKDEKGWKDSSWSGWGGWSDSWKEWSIGEWGKNNEEWERDEEGRFYWHVPNAERGVRPFKVYETPEEAEWYEKKNKENPPSSSKIKEEIEEEEGETEKDRKARTRAQMMKNSMSANVDVAGLRGAVTAVVAGTLVGKGEAAHGVVLYEKIREKGLQIASFEGVQFEWREIAGIVLMLIGLYQIVKWVVAATQEVKDLCCCKKVTKPHEKEKEQVKVVYVTGGGQRYHLFTTCHTMAKSKKQKRELCKFCEREEEKVRETAEFLKRSVDQRRELEAREAHTEEKQD